MSASSDYLYDSMSGAASAVATGEKSKTSATQTKSTSEAANTQAYKDELGDIDVWAAEQSLSDSKDAANKSYAALANLNTRSVGGGSFNSLVSGRGNVNLGSLTGGLSAANTAAVKTTKQADAAGDLAAAQEYAASEYDASVKAASANQSTDANSAAMQAAAKYSGASSSEQQDLMGTATGIGNYRVRKNPTTGELQYSDSAGNFPA